jgi:hypothetical protein
MPSPAPGFRLSPEWITGKEEEIIVSAVELTQRSQPETALLGQFERDYGKDNKQDCQDDGELEQGFLYTPAGPVNRICLTEDASQASAFHLEKNG